MEMDEIIKFNDKINGLRYLLSGWHDVEEWGVWSRGNASMSMLLPGDCSRKKSCKLVLNMHVFYASKDNPKRIMLRILPTH